VLYLDPLLALYDFAQFNKMADLGGGWGGFLIKVLQNNPQLEGILFDRPEVLANTAKAIESCDVSQRITTVGGSFFEQIPSGADCYSLCRVLLNWNDQQAVEILSNCKKVMQPGAKLLILDFCIPDPEHPSYPVLVNNDLNLLMTLGGASRTTEQWQGLVEAAGLKVQNLHMAPSALLFLLEATL
jgi:ubiquinone/menaquinone biosynthesis C-methylase UbiE